jgi:hypothetical protein
MILDQLSLPRQVDMVFKQIKGELTQLSSGTLFIQIRSNAIGKFGIKHLPLETKGGHVSKTDKGLSENQIQSFRKMAIDCLDYKNHWTHGEIVIDFAVRNGVFLASIAFESNYNMANLAKSV